MQTYCLSCKKHINNIGSKKVIMANKVIREKSRYDNCVVVKSRFLKQKANKKTSWNNSNLKLFIYLTYCLKCKKNKENVNSKLLKTKNGRTLLLSKCAVCGSKMSRFIKELETKELLSSLGLKTSLNKILLLGKILS